MLDRIYGALAQLAHSVSYPVYSVCVSEGYLYARAIVHPSPAFGGDKLPFSRGKCSNDSSIIRWEVAPVLFFDDEGCDTAIYGREGLIADTYDVFSLWVRLLVCQNPGSDARCLLFSFVAAPPSGL